MSTRSIKRTLACSASTTVAVLGLLVGTAGVAHAGESAKERSKAAVSGSSVAVLPPGASNTYPTWLFGTTRVCVTNWGFGVPGRLRVQSQVVWGAPPEYIDVPGTYEKKCIDRWWGAANVELTNVSAAAPLLVEVS